MLKAPRLFCKTSSKSFNFHNANKQLGLTVSFRPLDLNRDLRIIYDWVNREYAKDYWQLNGSYSMLYALYQCMDGNPGAASFIGELWRVEGVVVPHLMICQFDVYAILSDELKDHVDADENDCGFHLLMAPRGGDEKPVTGLTIEIIKSFLNYYFSFPEAKRMYAEPDVTNLKSILLLEKCGFKKIKTVTLSYKQAHIYCLEKPYR